MTQPLSPTQRAQLIVAADYLDRLEGRLIGMDADMKLPDDPLSPSVVADLIRKALTPGEAVPVAGVIQRLKEMHESCIEKAAAIDRGVIKSKMGASHYLDQAIGISHALDLLAAAPDAPQETADERQK